jgi:hypothetical protein
MYIEICVDPSMRKGNLKDVWLSRKYMSTARSCQAKNSHRRQRHRPQGLLETPAIKNPIVVPDTILYFDDIMVYMVHTLVDCEVVCQVSKVFLHTLQSYTKTIDSM